MSDRFERKKFPINIGSIFTGMVAGFLGAAVLYQKHFPDWVPSIFHGQPAIFFGVFIVVCGVLGYIWSMPD